MNRMSRVVCSLVPAVCGVSGVAPVGVIAGVVGVSGLVATATAQDSEAAKEILRASTEAIQNLNSLELSVGFSGDSSNTMLQGLTPVGEATLRMAKSDDPKTPWAARLEGSAANTGAGEREPFDLYLSSSRIGWTDFGQKIRNVRSTSGNHTSKTGQAYLLVPHEFFLAQPYSSAVSGAPVLEGQQEVDGVMCDVISFDPGGARAQAGVAGLPRTPGLARWYIGREDHLPRRIEREAGKDPNKIVLAQTFTNVKANAGVSVEELAFTAGNGFTLDESAERSAPPQPAAENPAANPGSQGRNSQPSRAPQPMGLPDSQGETDSADAGKAPDFELKDAEGGVVTLESLNGRVSVMYFWASDWCVQCRPYNELVSGLTDRLAADGLAADVYAVAVRERDPSRPVEMVADAGFSQTVLTSASDKGDTAYAAARAFKVKVYPSIAIIGEEGQILGLFEGESARPDEAQKIIEAVESAVRDHLGG